jgi:hypothetical protein
MKNIKLSFAILLMSMLVFAGCGKKKAKDIQVSELKTPCEIVDAMELVIDEVTDLLGNAKTKEELDADKLKELEALMMKLDEIDDAARDKFKKSEAEACPAWSRLQEKGEKLDEVFR